ncbi:MAG: hypothetical protein ACOYMV_08050 [Verrucomicrobiia bacterium]
MKNILAIDPGSAGGFAWHDGEKMCCTKMPATPGDVLTLVSEVTLMNKIEVCVIEQIPKFTGAKLPGSSVAVLFENYGILQGIIMARWLRLERVTPQKWQKHFGLGTKKDAGTTTQWKNKLKAEAQRRFPTVDVTLATADALLIWDYAMKQMKEEPK